MCNCTLRQSCPIMRSLAVGSAYTVTIREMMVRLEEDVLRRGGGNKDIMDFEAHSRKITLMKVDFIGRFSRDYFLGG